MTNTLAFAKKITNQSSSTIKYSVCTLVSRHTEYQEMYESFLKAGFDNTNTEYLYIDNAEKNEFEAFGGLNRFLLEAKGEYIILCHQDILLIQDNRQTLENCIAELDRLDPNWALLSNAGASYLKHVVLNVTELDGQTHKFGLFPTKVNSVDESFMLVKRSANLALSNDLSGFHLYGTDICILAEMLGYNSYVVNFNILHKSKGNVDQSFHHIKANLIRKYSMLFKAKYYQTTNTEFYLSNSSWLNKLMDSPFIMFFVNSYYRKKRRKFKRVHKL
jgi:hypothetical protein